MRVVQELEEARLMLRDMCQVISDRCMFITLKNSGCIAGVGYWHAVQRLLREEFPRADFTLYVCCGTNAAIAHDALRLGLNVRFLGSDVMRAKLEAIADGLGLSVIPENDE